MRVELRLKHARLRLIAIAMLESRRGMSSTSTARDGWCARAPSCPARPSNLPSTAQVT